MQNQNHKLHIIVSLFITILVGCTLPQGQATPSSPVKPVDISTDIPVKPKEEIPTNGNTDEGGSEPTEVPSSQNPLPPTVNLENSGIDLEKLGKDIVGGGGGDNCSEFLAVKTEQEITLGFDGLADTWKLCFINFPLGTALVTLSTPSGMFDTRVDLKPELEGVEAYALYINLPASVRRDGPLNVEFSVGSLTFSETFDVQTMDQVSIYEDNVNMLDVEYKSYPNYNIGDQIDILGVNLLPSTTVYVGIYGVSEFDYIYYPLIDKFQVTTNEAGEFLGAFQLTEKHRQGEYVIYYGYDSELFENRQKDRKYDKFTVGGISPTWQPCPANYASRLRVGDVGMVSDNPPLPNNVRNNPSLSGALIGKLQPGKLFIILDGPVCDGGWVWWYVQGASSNPAESLSGWTSEGDGDSYWLLKKH